MHRRNFLSDLLCCIDFLHEMVDDIAGGGFGDPGVQVDGAEVGGCRSVGRGRGGDADMFDCEPDTMVGDVILIRLVSNINPQGLELA